MSSSIVWISGSSRGIGRALAAAVPFDGARVIDISRSGPGDLPGVEHLAADLSTPAGWDAVADSFATELEGFAGDRVVFVHNAGVLEPIGFAGEVDADAYRTNVVLNSAAPQILGDRFLAAAAPLTCDRDLVLLTSGAASTPYAGWSAYCAGKAAADHWVRTVGAEQHRRGGVRVAAVAPGVVATGMQEQIRAADEDDFPHVARFHQLYDQGQLADPEDVAGRFWKAVTAGLAPGAVLDLRDG